MTFNTLVKINVSLVLSFHRAINTVIQSGVSLELPLIGLLILWSRAMCCRSYCLLDYGKDRLTGMTILAWGKLPSSGSFSPITSCLAFLLTFGNNSHEFRIWKVFNVLLIIFYSILLYNICYFIIWLILKIVTIRRSQNMDHGSFETHYEHITDFCVSIVWSWCYVEFLKGTLGES